MKKTVLAMAVAIASLNSAYAQAPQNVEASAKQLRYTIGMGFTHGGDKLAETSFTDGRSETIRAGGLVAFVAGADYRFNKRFSMQGNVGFHVDNSTAENGDVHFRRYPIELLGYFHPSQNWRIGGGVRFVNAVRAKASGAAGNYNIKFDNAIGEVIEAEYMVGYTASMKVRLVREKYKLSDYRSEVDGNHVGIFGNFYF